MQEGQIVLQAGVTQSLSHSNYWLRWSCSFPHHRNTPSLLVLLFLALLMKNEIQNSTLSSSVLLVSHAEPQPEPKNKSQRETVALRGKWITSFHELETETKRILLPE